MNVQPRMKRNIPVSRSCVLARLSSVAILCAILLANATSDGILCCAYSVEKKHRIAVIGGGSSGMFAAASIVDTLHKHQDDSFPPLDCIEVKVYESTGQVLRSIRSNHKAGILHDTSKKPRELINAGYPRGRKEVTSLLTKHFPPLKQQTWFEDRGVQFKTQQDGAMVCVDNENENSSAQEQICGAILRDCEHVLIETKAKVTAIAIDDPKIGGFQLTVQHGDQTEHCDCVVLATGNSLLGHQLAKTLGHTITAPARSCFAFKLTTEDTPALSHLQEGIRYFLPNVRLSFKTTVKGQKRPRVFKSEGPAELELACNENGAIILGGKAALSLSSLIPHELKNAKFKGTLLAHLCPDHLGGKVETLEEYLWQHRQNHSREVIGERCPLYHHYVDYDDYDWETDSFKTIKNECIPPDLWQGLTRQCGAPHGSLWSKMSPKKVRKLAEAIVGCTFEIVGKNNMGSASTPFINTGGILLSEVDMSMMQSKAVEGVFCCGQVLDGDASQGSFLLMRDFATGKVAGEHAALFALKSLKIL